MATSEIHVIWGDGAVPGEKTFIRPVSKVSASIEMIPDDEPASVTIGGGETEAFFQFRIPKGKGDKGDKGTDAAEITGINLTSNGGLHFVLSDGRELSTDSVIGPAGRNVQKVTLEGDGMLRFDMSDGTSLKAGPVFEGGTVVVDASTTAKGVVQLAGDLGGTADLPTVPGLADKAAASDLAAVKETADGALSKVAHDASLAGDGTAASPLKAAAAAVGDATTTSKGVVQLAGDLAGTADLPTVPSVAAVREIAEAALSEVTHDTTLSGDGTTSSPLKVVGGGGTSSEQRGWVSSRIPSGANGAELLITFAKGFSEAPVMSLAVQCADPYLQAQLVQTPKTTGCTVVVYTANEAMLHSEVNFVLHWSAAPKTT